MMSTPVARHVGELRADLVLAPLVERGSLRERAIVVEGGRRRASWSYRRQARRPLAPVRPELVAERVPRSRRCSAAAAASVDFGELALPSACRLRGPHRVALDQLIGAAFELGRRWSVDRRAAAAPTRAGCWGSRGCPRAAATGAGLVQRADEHRPTAGACSRSARRREVAEVADAPRAIRPQRVDLRGDSPCAREAAGSVVDGRRAASAARRRRDQPW